MEDKDLCITILETLTRQFKHATKSDWHSSQTLDLNLVGLQSLPKSLHLLQPSNDDGPLLHLPTDTSNARVIGVLTDIFCTVNDDKGLIAQVRFHREIPFQQYLLFGIFQPWIFVARRCSRIFVQK